MASNEHVQAKHSFARLSTLAFALLCVLALAWPYWLPSQKALAEDIDTDPSPDALQQEVERTAAALEEANQQVADASAAIDEKNARIGELEKLIPVQQARSDAAARELYKFEQETPGVVDFLLSSESFFDFLSNIDYMNRVSEANVVEINRLNEMKTELDSSLTELEQAKVDADARAAEADRALAAAQEARLEAQRKAQEKARQEAEAAAAAAAAAEQAAQQEAAKKEEESKPKDEAESESSGDTEAAAVATPSPAPEPSVSEDGADWSEDEATFISQWAPRIDAYLEGSPMSGQGTTFARAAWEYGVDPRWSPAISFTESTKGEYCFLPHNAWGWGSESWDSWEEAIDDHVRGLARGYGYTISMEAARKYCPPNADMWYERTLSQMEMI